MKIQHDIPRNDNLSNNFNTRDARNAADIFGSLYRFSFPDPYLMRQLCLEPKVVSDEHLSADAKLQLQEYEVCNANDSIFVAEAIGISNLLGIPIVVRPDQVGEWLHLGSGVHERLWADLAESGVNENEKMGGDFISAARLLTMLFLTKRVIVVLGLSYEAASIREFHGRHEPMDSRCHGSTCRVSSATFTIRAILEFKQRWKVLSRVNQYRIVRPF
jgi:hypothetical protein